jgi:hypothetical protein
LKPIEHCKEAFIPALFAAANNDTFILPTHTQRLYKVTIFYLINNPLGICG